jgi:hypothetical protein
VTHDELLANHHRFGHITETDTLVLLGEIGRRARYFTTHADLRERTGDHNVAAMARDVADNLDSVLRWFEAHLNANRAVADLEHPTHQGEPS